MSKIRGRDTKPELIIREILRGSYLRYQPNFFGKPDFLSKSKKVAVFIDGCFWHGCKKCYRSPKSNVDYWVEKKKRNKKRDKEVTKKLTNDGFKVIRIWEHDVMKKPVECGNRIIKYL